MGDDRPELSLPDVGLYCKPKIIQALQYDFRIYSYRFGLSRRIKRRHKSPCEAWPAVYCSTLLLRSHAWIYTASIVNPSLLAPGAWWYYLAGPSTGFTSGVNPRSFYPSSTRSNLLVYVVVNPSLGMQQQSQRHDQYSLTVEIVMFIGL